MSLKDELPPRLFDCVALAAIGWSNTQIALAFRTTRFVISNYFRLAYDLLNIGDSPATGEADPASRITVCNRWAREAKAGLYFSTGAWPDPFAVRSYRMPQVIDSKEVNITIQ